MIDGNSKGVMKQYKCNTTQESGERRNCNQHRIKRNVHVEEKDKWKDNNLVFFASIWSNRNTGLGRVYWGL